MNNKTRQAIACSIAAILVVTMTMTFCGCTTEENIRDGSALMQQNEQAVQQDKTNAESELEAPKALEVQNFGWTLNDEGYVNFAIEINNPNNYVEAMEPSITVTVLDENNQKIAEETTTISAIKPKDVYCMSYVANKDAQANGKAAGEIADLAVSVSVADEGWKIYDGSDTDVTTEIGYVLADQNSSPSEIDGVTVFSGKIAVNTDEGQPINRTDSALDKDSALPAYVNIVLYGNDDHIAGGYYDVVDVPLNGDVVDYTVYAFDAPAYQGYKVFVHPYDYNVS